MNPKEHIPYILVTGISDSEKTDVLKHLKKIEPNREILLYEDRMRKEYYVNEPHSIRKSVIREVVHDVKAATSEELSSILTNRLNDKDNAQMIIDVPISFQVESLYDICPFSRLQEHIHVLDAERFWFDYSSSDTLMNRQDAYTLGELFITTLEEAHTIILSNAKNAPDDYLAELICFIRKLQPLANIFTIEQFMTMKTDSEENDYPSHSLYKHQIELFKRTSPLSFVGDHGMNTFVYQSHLPIDLNKLEDFFNNLPDGLLRTKGMCTPTIGEEIYYISQIGPSIEFHSDISLYGKGVSAPFLTELLFIGYQLDKQMIAERLEECLFPEVPITHLNTK